MIELTDNPRHAHRSINGFDASRLAVLDDRMRALVEGGQLPGFCCYIARDNQPVYIQAVGTRDRERKLPMTLDTIVRIFSLSKPVTAAAVLALVEDGEFLLTDPVAKYMPQLAGLKVLVPGLAGDHALEAACRDITIRDLLTHTAGFAYGNDCHDPVDKMYIDAELFGGGRITLRQLLDKLSRLPLKHHPGAAFEYSVSFDVLGALVEVVSGTSFESFLRERLFAPLGMEDTAFHVPATKLERFSALYGRSSQGELIEVDSPISGRYRAPVALKAGGQGLVSTIADFQRFANMLYQNGTLDGVRCLGRKSVELMTMDHLPPGMGPGWMPGYGYGLGVGVLRDVAAYGIAGSQGEFTWSGSSGTYFWIDRREKLVAILFTQYEAPVEINIAREFKSLMYQALL